jgi:Flp pilus assembly protein TadG
MRGRARVRSHLASACVLPTVARAAGVRGNGGQSTVEVVALLPLLLAAGLAMFSLLHAGRAEEAAGNAAEAGAVALLQGREPRAAVRAALAGWPEQRAMIQISGRRVTVRVTPAGPFGARLRASATADAGARR